jgi:hypothetical protein
MHGADLTTIKTQNPKCRLYLCLTVFIDGKTSVADPDPPDPHVFGPPGSGSGSISESYGSGSLSKNNKKKLDFYCFVASF